MKINEGKKSATTNNSIVHVPVNHIVTSNKLTYRKVDQEHVDGLMDDIRRNGLLQPLVVFAENADKKVKIGDDVVPARFLAAGLHRRAAILKLFKNHNTDYKKIFPNGVPCTFLELDAPSAMMVQLRENVQRREMSAEEIFPVLDRLSTEFKLTGKDIAKKIGKTPAWVSQMMTVNTELDEETREEVVGGKIDVGDARKLAADVRKDRKAGKAVSKEEIREKASKLKDKKAAKSASGKSRASGDDRKVSATKIFARYQVMPKISQGRRLEVLEETLRYLAGDLTRLPAELRNDPAPEKE